MSCYHHIVCADCREECGDDDLMSVKWGEKPLLKLFGAAPLLAKLAYLGNGYDICVDVTVQYGARVPLTWFRDHGDHRLIVVDEYGKICPCPCGKEHSGMCAGAQRYEAKP